MFNKEKYIPANPKKGDWWKDTNSTIIWEYDGEDWRIVKIDAEEDIEKAYNKAMKEV